MPEKDPREVFLMLLSHVRQGTERGAKLYDEIGDIAKDPEIKEAIEARAFIARAFSQDWMSALGSWAKSQCN